MCQKCGKVRLVNSDEIELTEIDFAQLHRDGALDSFIDDLQELSDRQQEDIAKYKHRKFLAPIIGGLQSKVDCWHMLIETRIAFRNKLQVSERK